MDKALTKKIFLWFESGSGGCVLVDEGANNEARQLIESLPSKAFEVYFTHEEDSVRLEQIRKLQNFLALKSWGAARRLAIILSAETMTEEASSALLKTLEEPREEAIILLAVTSEKRLLPTILSRCQIFRLQKKINTEAKKPLVLNKDNLNDWILYSRQLMLESPDKQKYLKALENILETKFLLATTNVNISLALENLALKLFNKLTYITYETSDRQS